ncbi:protein-disulfide reductase DsbD domain-containing protein [Loktanella agnita]
MLTLLMMTALPGFALADPYNGLAEAELLPGWRNANGDHIAGLRITLQPGWKTYWRAPGDTGIPPQFSFDGSHNITAVAPHFPIPDVFHLNGMRAIGYADSIVFPLTVFSNDPDAPMQISGQINMGVCEEICMPVTLDFDALLPAGGARDPAITAALINRPLSRDEAHINEVVCTVTPISDGLRLTASLDVPPIGPSEVVVIEAGDPHVWVSEADVTRIGPALSATVDMVHSSGQAFALDRSAVRITLLGQDRAIDIQGCAAG